MKTITIVQDPFRTFKYFSIAVGLLVIALAYHDIEYVIYPSIFILLLAGHNRKLEIDAQKGRFRIYNTLLWIPLGKWQSLEGFTSIVTITRKVSYGSRSIFNISMNITTPNLRDSQNNVFLMKKGHRTRLFLNEFGNRQKAEKFADEISACLDIPVEAFSPARSQSTLNRIRQRRGY